MKFDELNKLWAKQDYFEPMALSTDSKAKRRELADLLTDAFLYFFSVYEVHQMHNSMLEKALYEQLLADRISDAVSKVTGIDGEISSHIRTLAKEVVETTEKYTNTNTHIERDSHTNNNSSYPASRYTYAPSFGPDPDMDTDEPLDPLNVNNKKSLTPTTTATVTATTTTNGSHIGNDNNEYWLSIQRAINIAQSESNTIFNYTDFLEAKEKGYTKKTWLTMLDPKVRDSHEEIEGQTVGIDEFFQVGNSQMRFPHDWEMSPDPKEVVNCRCAVEYK